MAARNGPVFPKLFWLLAALPLLVDAQTSVTLLTSPNPSVFGAPVLLTASVTPLNATGRVTFYDGVAILGTTPLVSGRASISTILLPPGSRKLRAYYGGDSGNAAATSNVITQRVDAIPVTNFVAGSTFPDLAQSFVADFNGDGIADIARGYSGIVYLGDGKGNFQSAFTVGSLIAAVGDFNGDGKTDLATRSGILLGNGDGTFQSPVANPALGSTPVVVADFNGDGKADLATQSGVLLGNGDGTFQPAIGPGPGFLFALVAGDFNGDGIPDLAAADGSNTTILLGNGNGTFRPSNQPPIPTRSFGLATADFNGDGIPDLAIINAVPGSSSLDIYLGRGDGTFQTPQAYTPPGGQFRSDYILAGDFNGDGIVDLLLNSNSTNSFIQYDSILLGNGDGTFQTPVSFPGGSREYALLADFNGDGKPDLLFDTGLLFGTAATLTPTGGTTQTAAIGTPFAAPLEVLVRDNGVPVNGATVKFLAPSPLNGGPTATLSSTTAVTNASGVASVTATANALAGSYTVTAGYQSTAVSFSLTNTNVAGPPASITASGGSPQSAAVGTAFRNALQATVKDSAGNPVPGVTVTFAMPAAGPSAAGAVLSSTTAVTNASGIASVTATANNTPGSYVVTATAGTLSAAFSLTNLLAASVTLTAQNPSIFGAPVTLTATVTPSNAPGRVTFYDGVTILGTKLLSAGTASISTILLPAGTRRLTAFYNGGVNYLSPTSNVVTQRVNAVAGGGFLVQSPVSVSPASPTSVAVAVGDFNGDGKADFVSTGGTGSSTVTVALGRGDGSFQTPVNFPVGTNPRFVAVGDFDGDGIPDLAVNGSVLNILLGNGDGTFRQGASYPASALPVSVADFNGDGVADLAVGGTIWIGNGDGTFHSTGSATASAVEKSVVSDFNGDGKADLVITALSCFTMITPMGQRQTICTDYASVYLGNGDGTFQSPLSAFQSQTTGFSPANANILVFAVGDFNGDGKPDFAYWDGVALDFLPGNGDGTFGSPLRISASVGGSVTNLTSGDFNGDGIIDLAVVAVTNSVSTVNLLASNGDGSFQSLGNQAAAGSADALAVADFNGDGKADLIIANAAGGSMSVLLGAAPGSGFQLSIAGGTSQSARTGGAFAVPLAVTLLNNGVPASGVTVTFAASTANFSPTAILSRASAVTNASGVASVTAIANEVSGSYAVTATAQGLIVSFSLTNTGAQITLITPSGTPQSTAVGTAFPSSLQVTVQGVGPVGSGVVVRFTAPASGASAVLSSATAVTNDSGVASVTATANGIVGSYTVTASVGDGAGALTTQFAFFNLAGGVSNLAQGKTATQSSTLPGYIGAGAASAVDGNPDGNFFDNSVTATVLDGKPWWQVDLGASTAVDSIVIWNRTDCCGSRLSEYWVFVSDTPFLPSDSPTTLETRANTFSSHQTSAPNPSTTIAVGAQGRYVRVQLSSAVGTYLSLAEVQVFGTARAPAPTNVALGKAASQSSTFPGYSTDGASAAVDSNTDGNFFDGSVTATNLDANAWWQVDLGASATVSSVVVFNRTDCCGSRLGDFWVFISDTPFHPTDTPGTLRNRPGTFSSHQASAPNPSTTITTTGAQGRYVRVQLSGTDYLSLAEVQVLGSGGVVAPTNVAPGKSAAQSSTFPGYGTDGAASAVDDNTDGNFFDGSVTATNLDPNPWWQVDLGASTAVSSIAIFNRTDCCGSRLSDYWVFVSDTPFLATDTPATLQGRPGTFASHQTTAPNPSTTITASPQGRYVRVQLSGAGYLSLAEVQVFGH